MTGAPADTALTNDARHTLLRGIVRDGFIGMMAIDRLIAALMAPSFDHPDESPTLTR